MRKHVSFVKVGHFYHSREWILMPNLQPDNPLVAFSFHPDLKIQVCLIIMPASAGACVTNI